MRISDWSSDVCSSDLQYEIGGKVALGRFNAPVALFQTDRPQTLTIINDANESVFTVNGLQRNKGIEFSLDGEPVKGLRVIAGLSITDAKQSRTQGGATDGLDAIGVPAYTANVNEIGRASGRERVCPYV